MIHGRILLIDLQAVGPVLRGFAVHIADPNRFTLMDNNLQAEGFMFIFATNEWNKVCEQLNLKRNASIIGEYRQI